MSTLKASWLEGRVIPGSQEHPIWQEYICYGCGHACRCNVPVRTAPPIDCIKPDILARVIENRNLAILNESSDDLNRRNIL